MELTSTAPVGQPQRRIGAPDLLEAIVAATRHEVACREQCVSLDALERVAAGRSPRAAAFRADLAAPGGFNVIAECKRRSPSKGVLRADYHPERIAREYEAAGAAAISVLTEPAFFDGALRHLAAVREQVALPLLRKDFIVSRYQLVEARAAGADAVAAHRGRARPTISCAACCVRRRSMVSRCWWRYTIGPSWRVPWRRKPASSA